MDACDFFIGMEERAMAMLRPSNALGRQPAELLEPIRMLFLQSRPLLEEDGKFLQTCQLRELANAYVGAHLR